ncbi:helix-turn-helix domain-containing protein [Streptomyces sp. NPDC006477]|uniref:helix-turn-helix domain-containing protein n=1 Tax=Streptomyces sp. NPDC006477 TaxID=3364747 RepID=UPI00369E4C84
MPNEEPAWVRTRRVLVGSRIREARLDADLSQVELADRVGLDHKTIHRIEHGTSDPKLGTLIQIAEATGVPLPELVR